MLVGKVMNRVPSEYEEVEYIHGDGSQYIDTGIIPSGNDWEIEAEWVVDSDAVVAQTAVFGSQGNTTNTIPLLTIYSTSLYICGSTTQGQNRIKGFSFAKGIRYLMNIKGSDGTVSAILNSATPVVYEATTNMTDLTRNMNIFRNASASNNQVLKGSIYKFYWKQNGVVIRDYIPVKKKANNEYGLYDLVSKNFFGNSGTGSFTGGSATPVKTIKPISIGRTKLRVPSEYQEVEYIETDGNSYINTGVYANQDTMVEAVGLCTAQQNIPLFGARWSSTTPYHDSYTCWMQLTSQGKARFDYNQQQTLSSGAISLNEIHTFKKQGIYNWIDGEAISSSSTETFTTPVPLHLLCCRSDGSSHTTATSGTRIYSCKIAEDGINLDRYLVSVKKKSNNEYGMYDLVSKQFFGNAGTGSFTGGNPVNNLVVKPLSTYRLKNGILQ